MSRAGLNEKGEAMASKNVVDRKVKPRKLSRSRRHVTRLEDLPNVGPATAADLRLLGFETPAELRRGDAFDMYRRLNEKTGVRHDQCVLDVFMAVVDFMNGHPAKPWWRYTPERKKRLLDGG